MKKWKVPSSSSDKEWTVAQDENGNYGCECPVWKFRRQECHHIRQVKNGLATSLQIPTKPKYVLAKVLKPTFKAETNELLIPLVAIPDAHMMEATIIYTMLKHGYSMTEIREIRNHIPADWTMKAIIGYVEEHGEAEYPQEWYRH